MNPTLRKPLNAWAARRFNLQPTLHTPSYDDENLWLSQKMMGELFSVTKQTISEHLVNIFESNELNENSAVRNYLTTAVDVACNAHYFGATCGKS